MAPVSFSFVPWTSCSSIQCEEACQTNKYAHSCRDELSYTNSKRAGDRSALIERRLLDCRIVLAANLFCGAGRDSALRSPGQRPVESKLHKDRSKSDGNAKASSTQQNGTRIGTNQMSVETPGNHASSQTATLPPSEAPSSSSKAAANGADVASKTPTRSPKASSQAEALPPAKTTSSNGSFGSQAKTGNKPLEAVADVPDERSDRSFVMPSSAAAQAATGASVANAESAAMADRQTIGGKSPCLNSIC